jgi:hypothetical protein
MKGGIIMYMIAISCYPQESASELGKRFTEAKPAPDFLTTIGPFVRSTLEGTKTIAIYEFDPSKYAEATDYLSNRYAAYHGVPGFKYSLEHWLEVKDALKLIGLG